MEKQVKDLTFSDLAKMARQDAEAFATDIIGEGPTYRNGREVRYYENQSLSVGISGSKQGRYQSFTDDNVSGDLFDLHRYVRGGTPHDAAQRYKSFAGLIQSAPNERVLLKKGPTEEEVRRQEEKDIAERKGKAAWIWKNASITDGRDEGLAYLRGRGITTVPDTDTVRFRKLTSKDLEKMKVDPKDIPATPVVAVIFRAQDADGKTSAVQQVLTTNGRKVSFPMPKRTNGSMMGSSVNFAGSHDATKQLVAEGPETSMSLHEATGLNTKCTLGTSNYTNISVSKEVDTLIFGTDIDANNIGLAATLRAVQFWSRRGVANVGIAIPRLSLGDFNDVHQRDGADAVKKAVDHAFFPDKIRHDDVILVTPDARVAFHAWKKTGVSTAVKIPPVSRTDGSQPDINLDTVLEDHHRTVIIVESDAIKIDTSNVEKTRPDIMIIRSDDDCAVFLENAKTEGYIDALVSKADIYSPSAISDTGAIAITSRRKDADALVGAGHNAIAIRPSVVADIDLSFLDKKKVIIAPVGTGGAFESKLASRLEEQGNDVQRLAWQIFHPTPTGLTIVRDHIPKGYGAAEAVNEGWKGKAMKDLLLISKMNRDQLSPANDPKAIAKKTEDVR